MVKTLAQVHIVSIQNKVQIKFNHKGKNPQGWK